MHKLAQRASAREGAGGLGRSSRQATPKSAPWIPVLSLPRGPVTPAMSRRAADTRGVVAGSRAGAGRAADPWVVAEVLLPRESVGFACRDWTCRRSVETVRPGGDPSDRLSQRAGRAGAVRVPEPCGGAGRAPGVTGGGAGRARWTWHGTGSAGQGGRAGRELAQRAGRGAETGGLGGFSDATHSVVSQASRDQGQTRRREGQERDAGKPHGARGPGSGSRGTPGSLTERRDRGRGLAQAACCTARRR